MNIDARSWFLLLLLAIIWGSSFRLIELSLSALTPNQVGLLRIIIAALCLLPFSLHQLANRSLPWRWLALIGVIGNLLPALLFAAAQQVLHSALAGMLNTLQPLFAILVSVLAFKRHIPHRQIYGLLVAFMGSLFLIGFTNGNLSVGQHMGYSLLIITATVCYGISTNLIKEHCQQIPSRHIAAISLNILLVPSVILLLLTGVPSLPEWEKPMATSLISVLLLGSIGTSVALVIFNSLIKKRGIVFASMVTYLIPIVATVWGLLADEPIHPFHLLGLATILIGLWIVNYQQPSTPIKKV